jgi:molybdopterin converting factor small subunit
MAMSSELRSVTVKLPAKLYEQVRVVARKNGETFSDTVRELLSKGLSERVYRENLELLTGVVRGEMEKVARDFFASPPGSVEKRRIIERLAAAEARAPVDPRHLTVLRGGNRGDSG